MGKLHVQVRLSGMMYKTCCLIHAMPLSLNRRIAAAHGHLMAEPVQLKFAGFSHFPTTGQHSKGLVHVGPFGQWQYGEGGGPASSAASKLASAFGSTVASVPASRCSVDAFVSITTSEPQCAQERTTMKRYGKGRIQASVCVSCGQGKSKRRRRVRGCHSPICLEMMIFMISFVPANTRWTRASM